MKRFVYNTLVDAPIKQVADFYRRPDAFLHLNPPGMMLQMHRNAGVGEGSAVEFTMWLGPIPVHWTAVHSDVDWRTGFTDTQTRGPFAYWVHRHIFMSIGEGATQIVDEVTAEFGPGIYSGIASRLMWLGLPALFAYRKWATRRQVKRMAGVSGRPRGVNG